MQERNGSLFGSQPGALLHRDPWPYREPAKGESSMAALWPWTALGAQGPGNQKSSKLPLSLIKTEKVLFFIIYCSNSVSFCITWIIKNKGKKVSEKEKSTQNANSMSSLQLPSVFFKIPVFNCFRHEVVITFLTSYWKLVTGKEDFIPCIYLFFQNNPLGKVISAADIQLVFYCQAFN